MTVFALLISLERTVIEQQFKNQNYFFKLNSIENTKVMGFNQTNRGKAKYLFYIGLLLIFLPILIFSAAT